MKVKCFQHQKGAAACLSCCMEQGMSLVAMAGWREQLVSEVTGGSVTNYDTVDGVDMCVCGGPQLWHSQYV